MRSAPFSNRYFPDRCWVTSRRGFVGRGTAMVAGAIAFILFGPAPVAREITVALSRSNNGRFRSRRPFVSGAFPAAEGSDEAVQGTCDETRGFSASGGLFPYSRSSACDYARINLDNECSAATPGCRGCCRMEECICRCLFQDFGCWCVRAGNPFRDSCQ